MIPFYVHVAPTIPQDELHYEDKKIEGVYLVEAGADETNPLTITAVLDEFHESFGIKVLDDFEIGVKNGAGEWMVESDNEDDPDPDDKPSASFCGLVDDAPLRESQEPPPRTPRPSM